MKPRKWRILLYGSMMALPILAVGYYTNRDFFDDQACKVRGGEWVETSSNQRGLGCKVETNDAGKECTDSTQCKSYCEAPVNAEFGAYVTGSCHKYSIYDEKREVFEGRYTTKEYSQ
ncbi:hypothetical protein ACFL2D_01950 [Patescibacteria group bacterium]